MARQSKLHKVYIFNVLIINLVTILLLGSIWIVHEYRQYNADVKLLKNDFLEDQKAIIKNEVENSIDYIDKINKDIDNDINIMLESRVKETMQIVNSVYLNHHNQISPQEIKKLIKDILRNLKFGNTNNYIFILTDKGIEELYPPSPELEGQNLLNISDSLIRVQVRKEISLALMQGKGIIRHNWVNPKTKEVFQKVTYIQHFKPYNWIIGTGINYHDYIQELQKDIITRLSNVRFGRKKEGYLLQISKMAILYLPMVLLLSVEPISGI
ncbi:MAG: hypothetical protein HC905_22730 [Bacteroidales bacterium]|nr:hypothetical protein [Bacteroidales bacterium]